MKQQLTEKQLIELTKKEKQKLNAKQKTFRTLIQAIKETVGTEEALKEIKKQKGNYLVKLGTGILVEAEIKTDKCKKSLGQSGYVEEDIDETINNLGKRKTNLEKQAQKLEKEIILAQQKLTQMISIIKQIQIEKKKNFSKAAQN